jgi:hypothetical protein
MAAFFQGGASGTTVNPAPFLTGTSSHSRAYTIQINRAVVGTAVSFVGFATAANATSLSLASLTPAPGVTPAVATLTNGDLIIFAASDDNPTTPGGWNRPQISTTNRNFDIIDNGREFDTRQGTGPGLGYQIASLVWSNTDGTTINNIEPGDTNTPVSFIAMVFRGAATSVANGVFSNGLLAGSTGYGSLDIGTVNNNRTIQPHFDVNSRNDADAGDVLAGSTLLIGPPDPPSLTLNANNPLVLTIGMIDDTKIANVVYDPVTKTGNLLPPTVTELGVVKQYELIAANSYGVQNNGLIIMTAYRGNIKNGTEDPSAYTGDGANVWAAQTIIIGGPGSDTGGTNFEAGRWGGGGASRSDTGGGAGMAGADGTVRLIWGTGRQYPFSNTLGDAETPLDWVP